jgi:digeranylgeranylglycerophospholipid reductase
VVQVRAEIVIGADGSKSNIAQWSGLLAKDDWHSNLIRAYELKVEGVDIDGFNLYFLPKIAPGGYAWIFQKGKAIANIGIATTERDSVVRLERFMKHLDLKGRIISRTGGAIPYRGPVRRSYGDGVMVVGDAAGQTNPIFLGGIFTAMQCGRIAGEVAVESIKARDVSAAFLSRYEKAWRRLPLADDSLVRTAKIIHSSTPERVSDVISHVE